MTVMLQLGAKRWTGRRGAVVTANFELASQILDDGLYYGDAQATVAALDEAYQVPAKTRG